jgi:5-methyltetrahydrofolate--homocysteine methyltransferase
VNKLNTRENLENLLGQRIVIIDGAMGTTLQRYQLDEAAYRGERFKDWAQDLKGNHDLLNLTRPDLVAEVHRAYLEAGADIIETNTFNAQAVSLSDYKMESLAYEMNVAAAGIARRVADEFMAEHPERACFVAGAIGPMNRALSLSPDVNNPAYRAVTYDQVAQAYYDQARGLVDGGVDILIVETVFDSLNSKAALFAIQKLFDDAGARLPVMCSFTITDASGRTLSGQTVEAYWNSVSNNDLLSVGINCALGPKEMRPFIEELSRRFTSAPIRTRACPIRSRLRVSPKRPKRWRRNCATGRGKAGSTSSAGVAARRRSTSARSRRRSKIARLALYRRSNLICG